MSFNRVILSSDTNPKFIEFWPLVAKGWRKFFPEVEIWLALVGDPSPEQLDALKKHGRIAVYRPIPGIPLPNQAKIARYHLAGTWADDSVNLINDIDLLPLQANYVLSLVRQRPKNHLLTVGAELYTGQEQGKFTAGCLTAESWVWTRLMNPNALQWTAFARSFIGMKVCDHKEDVLRTVHHEDPDTFSDESLLRAMLRLTGTAVFHAARGFQPYTVRALCRSNWMFDPAKLANGTYVEAHLPRPLSQHQTKIKPLIDYLELP